MKKKITQKEIKRFIKTGAAVDITNAPTTTLDEIKHNEKEHLTSFGIYGMNGALFVTNNGNIYGITSRCSSLFYMI